MSTDHAPSFRTLWLALGLARVRLRQTWMAVDPWLGLTALASIVLLRLVLRSMGVETSVANLLFGTAALMMALVAVLGCLTKRTDRRERRAMERKLRMQGWRLAPPFRLEPVRRRT